MVPRVWTRRDRSLHLHDHVLLLLDLGLHRGVVFHLVDRQVEGLDRELLQGRVVLLRKLAVPVHHQLHDRDRLVLARNRVFLFFLDDLGLVDPMHTLGSLIRLIRSLRRSA